MTTTRKRATVLALARALPSAADSPRIIVVRSHEASAQCARGAAARAAPRRIAPEPSNFFVLAPAVSGAGATPLTTAACPHALRFEPPRALRVLGERCSATTNAACCN
jgi:hypothetical protein